MRAARVLRLEGPNGVDVVDLPEPTAGAEEVLVDVHAAGISFPDLLLSAGKYQIKPELPFTIGVDFAGIVRTAPVSTGFSPGDRIAGWGPIGGAAQTLVAMPSALFHLPDAMSFEQGAGLPMNYLTAHFALLTRGGMHAGDTVLVHGAAGGVGTATIQVARAYGARVIAVVSSEARRAVAEQAGADEVILSDGFLASARELTAGRGVDVVVDVVGSTDLVLDSLRALTTGGRLLVVGFAAGEIAAVKLNRLLLSNIDIRGVAWGPYTRAFPEFSHEQWAELVPLMESGALAPSIGKVYPLADARQALIDMSERRITGKSVLTLR
ncbi:MAG: NADPH:quinone oxidoreductase family protein [Pseudonocardiales bacterium]|nr:NADPH:quinone oxidoreductase family protein [Pseudonocardiales bacterium]